MGVGVLECGDLECVLCSEGVLRLEVMVVVVVFGIVVFVCVIVCVCVCVIVC